MKEARDPLRRRPERQVLHIVRSDMETAHNLNKDWLTQYDARGGGWLLILGAANLSRGPINDDQLIELIFAADVAVVW